MKELKKIYRQKNKKVTFSFFMQEDMQEQFQL